MFGLIWRHLALEELAEVYITLTPDEQRRVSAAVEALNVRLRSNPLDEGESRSSGLRLTFIFKLSVLFHVSESEGMVHVMSVMRYGP
jgi:hypothetical protein